MTQKQVLAAVLHVYFRAPDDFHGQGLFIGGAYFPLKDGILKLPADGSYTQALPVGFVQVEGPKLPGETEAPRELSELQDGESVTIDTGIPQGDRGETEVTLGAADFLSGGRVPDGGAGTETAPATPNPDVTEAKRVREGDDAGNAPDNLPGVN